VASNIWQLDDVASNVWQLDDVAPYEVAALVKARVDDVACNTGSGMTQRAITAGPAATPVYRSNDGQNDSSAVLATSIIQTHSSSRRGMRRHGDEVASAARRGMGCRNLLSLESPGIGDRIARRVE